MSFVAAAIGAGASLVSGFMGASAASSAAGAQSAAAREAAALQARTAEQQLALQREMYQQQRADIAPYRQAGLTAQNRLLTLLGLAPTAGAMAPPTMFDQAGYDRALDAYYNRLNQLSSTAAGAGAGTGAPGTGAGYWEPNPDESGPAAFWVSTAGQSPEVQAATAQQINQMQMPTREQFTTTLPVDQLNVDTASPDYGKYARDFSMADFEADPGYAFRLSEGLKALDRQAAARGGLISGSALKASQRYGQEMGSQEYQNAFNRYQVNRANQLNPLMSITGYGQLATNTLGDYGSRYAAGASDVMGTSAANQSAAIGAAGQARASGYVGGANALSNALGGIANTAMDYSTLNRMFGSSPYGMSGTPAQYGSISNNTWFYGE